MIHQPLRRSYTGSMLAALLFVFAFTDASDVAAQTRQSWTTSRLKGSPTSPSEFRIRRAFTKRIFSNPTSILEIPATNEILLTQMNGSIFTFSKSDDSVDKHRVAELAQIAGGGVSLFSATLHPDFAVNGYLFVCLVHPEEGRHTRVSRFTTKRNLNGQLLVNSNSERVIIKWPAGGHNAGCLQFAPDGLLYISTGDGAGPNPPDGLTTGQTVDDLLGAILRIDVDNMSGDQNYAIPADNPFVGQEDARPEIYAYGLRNPWKFGIDSTNGDVFVADNGWETWEMVHHVKSGQNCGWPVMEGRVALRSEVEVGPTPIVPPARDHHHSEANSVIGGPVYHGEKLSGLDGFFVYGDYITGTIWALKPDADGYAYKDVVDTDLRIVDFTQGSKGELFVLDYDYTGGIYELLPNDVEDLSENFPRLLSETGLFTSVKDLQPAAGVLPYDVVVPRWQDGATAQRWIALPESDSIPKETDGRFENYPDGTVFAKHVSMPAPAATRLETQILHFDNGSWNPYSYLWNDAGTDAELVSAIGANKSVQWPQEDGTVSTRTWRASATNECRLCHNAGSHFVLGFTPAQLQKQMPGGKNFAGVLREAKAVASSGGVPANQALVDPHDGSIDLNDRARSYLHANCSMCHHKGGNAIVSFYLRRDMPFDELQTGKGTGIGTFGMQNAKIIVPGDPYRSVLMYRMSKLGYSRMPYIGSQVVDSKGVAMIAKWIESLPGERSNQTSPPLTAASAEASALKALESDQQASVKAEAVATLVNSTEGSLALITRFHSGQLTPMDRSLAVATAKTKGSDIRGLFDHFIPESERKKTLGRTFDPQLVLSKNGNARRGKLIFFASDARCRSCHHLDKAEQSVGPTLADISKKYIRRSELLQHIIKPSEKVDDRFAAWTVVTVNGRVFTGLKKAETAEGITLQTADGKTVTVAASDIEEQQKSRTSLMPEGVLGDLNAQEAADLLAFIQTIASTPFGGTAHAIPGKIEAEHYDEGVAEVAYHDIDVQNRGADYRLNTQVDIEKRDDASNGHGLGWTKKGEWVSYTVNVADDGVYSVTMAVASNKQGGRFHMEIDGKDVSGPLNIPDTGGWQQLKTITHKGIKLPKGQHMLIMMMDEEGPSKSIGDIDYFRFELLKAP